jgi:hypothetical protein
MGSSPQNGHGLIFSNFFCSLIIFLLDAIGGFHTSFRIFIVRVQIWIFFAAKWAVDGEDMVWFFPAFFLAFEEGFLLKFCFHQSPDRLIISN